MLNKNKIRKELIQQRNKLKNPELSALSHLICNQIKISKVFKQSQYIATYNACFNEVDLSQVLKSYMQGKSFLLPVIKPNNRMNFHSINRQTVMKNNKYNIPEPQNSPEMSPDQIELCLMPLVGFNRAGNRLGMGGGYYDRYFENNHKQKRPTILAGIAYDFQEDDTIQPEKWDIPLDIIFTNKEVIKP